MFINVSFVLVKPKTNDTSDNDPVRKP